MKTLNTVRTGITYCSGSIIKTLLSATIELKTTRIKENFHQKVFCNYSPDEYANNNQKHEVILIFVVVLYFRNNPRWFLIIPISIFNRYVYLMSIVLDVNISSQQIYFLIQPGVKE